MLRDYEITSDWHNCCLSHKQFSVSEKASGQNNHENA